MNSCGFGIRALYSDRDIRHEGYNHRYPATKKTPSATLTLKLMVLLLALATGVVGQYQDFCFSPMYSMKVIQSSGRIFFIPSNNQGTCFS